VPFDGILCNRKRCGDLFIRIPGGEAVRKARAGVAAAKTAYIPDVTGFARQSYQDGVPFLVRNFGTFGLILNWEAFAFGKRSFWTVTPRFGSGSTGHHSCERGFRPARRLAVEGVC
jgi:hypothetical protein